MLLNYAEAAVPDVNAAYRFSSRTCLGQGWLKVGDEPRAKSEFREAAKLASAIPNQEDKSSALSNAANGLAAIHEFRQARLAALPCSAVDQLTVYTAILMAYTGGNTRQPPPTSISLLECLLSKAEWRLSYKAHL